MKTRAERLSLIVEWMREPDVTGASLVHMQAFAGYMNTMIGLDYVRVFLRWFIADHKAIALVVREGADIVGYAIGAPVGYSPRMNRALLARATIGIFTHPACLLHPRMLKTIIGRFRMILGTPRLMVRGSRAEDRPAIVLPGPVMSLVGIGVSPSAQGKGIGSHLLASFEEASIRRGMRAMRLSVYADNAAARRAYERAGWRIIGDEHANPVYYAKAMAPATDACV